MRTLVMDLPSPLPLSRLGEDGLKVWASSLEDLLFRAGRGLSLTSGLGGKLLPRWSPRGGCGNELMLTVFLIVLPAAFTAVTPFG